MRATLRPDAAVSDIVGTIMLIGITVGLVGVAVGTLYSTSLQRGEAPHFDVKASALASPLSNGTVAMTHAGGAAYDRATLEYQVTAAGVGYGRGPLPGTGTWDIGQSLALPLNRTLAGGEHLEIQLISKSVGAVVSEAVVDVASSTPSGPPPGTFVIAQIQPAPGTTPDVAPGATLHVVAHVAHPEGRKAVATAWIDLSPLGGSTVTPLYDDGTRGDAIAGDMDFGSYVLVPPGAVPASTPVLLPLGVLDVDGNLGVSSSGVSVHVVPPASAPGTPGSGSNATFSNATFAGNSTFGDNVTFQNTYPVFGDNVTFNFTNATNVTFQNITAAPPGPPELREPDPFTPTSGPANVLVQTFGRNFTFLSSLRLTNGPGSPLVPVWWIVSDSEVDFIAPITSVAGDYNILVTNEIGSDTSNELFHLDLPLNAPTSPPEITDMTPTHGQPGADVKLTGKNLSFVTSIRMTAGANVFGTAFYVVSPTGTETHFFVPQAAPPGSYVITASSGGGSADAPTLFIVDPKPPAGELKITTFDPTSGRPFTQINITGTGFLDVVAANVGGANVAMWVTDDTHMSVLTHPAVPLQRFNHITLYNKTGSADACCFEALPANDVKEYAIYPASSFDRIAFNLTKTGNVVAGQLKFKLLNYSFATGSGATLETFTLTSVTMEVPNFKPGQPVEDNIVVLSSTTAPTRISPNPCRSAGTNGVYDISFSISPKKYSGSTDTMPFHFIFSWIGTKGSEYDLTVGSSLPTEDFTFGPQANTKIVKDGPNYDWPSSFTDCTATP